MARWSFDDLVNSVGAHAGSQELLDASLGIRLIPTRMVGFVPPSVVVDGALTGAQVLLVSAPAAVGKTTFAKELASAARAPVWDLSTTQVGSSSFVGGIVRAFGPQALPVVLSGLQDGRGLLVIDALDEAHLRSGYQNFAAFMGDVCEAIRGTTDRVTVVMFARVETALITELLLGERGIPTVVGRIDYFDEASARHFIDRRLVAFWAARNRDPQHRRNPTGFKQAVDSLFGFVANCFGVDPAAAWDSDHVRKFLGYAPVLQAIADYLSVDNLQTVLNELEASSPAPSRTPRAAWSFLSRVVASVVERERVKVMGLIRETMATAASDADWDDWESLYQVDEQLDRVLRRFFGIALFSDRTPMVPTSVRDEYERSLPPFADQHPFLTDARSFANLVFKEYAFAWSLCQGSPSVRSHVQRALTSGAHLPSPLLGRFILGLADLDDDGLPLVAPDVVGLLLDALSAAAERSGDVLVWLVTDESDATRGQIVSTVDDTDEVEFRIARDGNPVRFWRRLAHAYVVVNGGVVLGLNGQSFTLGPDVELETDMVSTPAAEYVVLGDPDSNVRLVAESHVDAGADAVLKVYSEGAFGVSWDPLMHPWYGYSIPTAGDREVSPPIAAAFDDLVRIVRPFRRHGRDELARKKQLIDNVAVGRSVSDRTAGARRLLGYLLDQGVLEESHSSKGLYILNLDRLGMSWTDVREHRMTDDALAFLEGFVAPPA